MNNDIFQLQKDIEKYEKQTYNIADLIEKAKNVISKKKERIKKINSLLERLQKASVEEDKLVKILGTKWKIESTHLSLHTQYGVVVENPDWRYSLEASKVFCKSCGIGDRYDLSEYCLKCLNEMPYREGKCKKCTVLISGKYGHLGSKNNPDFCYSCNGDEFFSQSF